MDIYDFGPSCRALSDLMLGTADDQLTSRTPCPDYTVADLCDHIWGLAVAFTHAATREPLSGPANASGDGSRLEAGWRDRIAGALDDLAAAWTNPDAYEGMTQAGPIELPGAVAGQVALNEVVVHGWDLAVATGRHYDADSEAVQICHAFASTFRVPGGGEGPFAAPVSVPEDAGDLDRLIGLTGRDPGWS